MSARISLEFTVSLAMVGLHRRSLNNRRNHSNGELDTPAVMTSKRNTYAIRDELSSGDRDGLDGDHCSPEPGRSKLPYIHWGDGSRSTHP